MVTFRQFDEDLKKKWHGTNDKVSVNRSIFVYVSKKKEEQFIKNMFPTEVQRQKYFIKTKNPLVLAHVVDLPSTKSIECDSRVF